MTHPHRSGTVLLHCVSVPFSKRINYTWREEQL
jgi:hypothetical protein